MCGTSLSSSASSRLLYFSELECDVTAVYEAMLMENLTAMQRRGRSGAKMAEVETKRILIKNGMRLHFSSL